MKIVGDGYIGGVPDIQIEILAELAIVFEADGFLVEAEIDGLDNGFERPRVVVGDDEGVQTFKRVEVGGKEQSLRVR
ncbi:MAG: hypothetical protein OEV41_06655, partial [Gammaproteobacteria bacterium]|nr:hypothetical protein [Gammaproteobacteria bacterium]